MKKLELETEKKFILIPESPEEHQLVFHLRNKEKLTYGAITFLIGFAFGLILFGAIILSALF